MQTVKVRRSGISEDQATEVILNGLGPGYRVEPGGEGAFRVRRGGVAKAKVSFRDEPGGTVFDVRGEGTWLVIPFSYLFTRMMNERGIAKRTAEVIDQAEAFHDGG
jgi:hypothetical protein